MTFSLKSIITLNTVITLDRLYISYVQITINKYDEKAEIFLFFSFIGLREILKLVYKPTYTHNLTSRSLKFEFLRVGFTI